MTYFSVKSCTKCKTLQPKLLYQKDKVKNDASQIFRSPSIYENNGNDQDQQENNHVTESEIVASNDDNPVMTRYLSGKFCPLTPSQQPTNVSHLVEANEKGGSNSGPSSRNLTTTSTALVPASPTLALTNYCSIM